MPRPIVIKDRDQQEESDQSGLGKDLDVGVVNLGIQALSSE